MEAPSAPRQITSHLLWYLTYLPLAGWPRFPRRLAKHFFHPWLNFWTCNHSHLPSCAAGCQSACAAVPPAAPRLGEGRGIPPSPGPEQGPSAIASGPPWCPSSPRTASLPGPGEAELINHICWHNSSVPQGNLHQVLK